MTDKEIESAAEYRNPRKSPEFIEGAKWYRDNRKPESVNEKLLEALRLFLDDNLKRSKEEKEWVITAGGMGWVAALLHVKANFLEPLQSTSQQLEL